MSKPSLKVGDRVQYSRTFLRSIGELTGPLPFAKGTITELTRLSEHTTLATIDWSMSTVPARVNVANLNLVGRVEPA